MMKRSTQDVRTSPRHLAWGYLLLSMGWLLCATITTQAEPSNWQEIPRAQWKGTTDVEVPALKTRSAAVLALPAKEAQPLEVSTEQAVAAGVYEVRVTLRPSHVADAVAFNAGVRVSGGAKLPSGADWEGEYFAQVHQPEVRTALMVHKASGPLTASLQAYADEQITELAQTVKSIKQGGGPNLEQAMQSEDADDDLDFELEVTLDPSNAVYYLVDKVEYRKLSGSGMIEQIELDRIRYLPAATLHAVITVVNLGPAGAQGTLNLYLEHRVGERVKVKSEAVTLDKARMQVSVALTLPERELGYALVGEFVSADGADRHEAAEYFGIARNFQRVAIFGAGLGTRDLVLHETEIKSRVAKAKAGYFNAVEYFAWAEDDMIEMSSPGDFWSSGQTNYRLHKQSIQLQNRLAQEAGIGVSTYGKFVMSGYPGWVTAYEYPNDHRNQYLYPIGMWENINALTLERRRFADFTNYSKSPGVKGNVLNPWWQEFLPINPDATPRMTRLAAEETIRSIEMFGWDAIRWDGQMRGYGQTGNAGEYHHRGARLTQTLVRYFKDVVATKYPDFRHGYNYLLIQPDKTYDWAVEDFELDELAREGGLMMNESIGNASFGWTFAQIQRNLQVEGDLCRERGGYYLGISYAKSPRDQLIEGALWAAAGCRPYSGAMTREVRRYVVRYPQYSMDENLRRLAQPERVLRPTGETRLQWQPFVYETPWENGQRELVVNLLNLPLDAKRPREDKMDEFEWDMPVGTQAVTFELTLPPGMRASRVTLIDPYTLEATELELTQGKFQVPALAIWKVLVLRIESADQALSLAGLYGVPRTFGVKREGVPDELRVEPVVLKVDESDEQHAEQVAILQVDWLKELREKEAKLRALTGKDREQALMERRETAEHLLKQWWKGAMLPADLKLKDAPPSHGDLSPRRNGRWDIYWARGGMDHRLHLPQVWAKLPTFRVQQAFLWGGVRQATSMGLHHGIAPQDFKHFDVLVYTGVPHPAIGVTHSYALVDYVKAGGAVLFTGGEYAFGKGGYMHTVLERELLPVLCGGNLDTLYFEQPQAITAGPDYADLNVQVDLAAKPSVWVMNQVVAKPGVKVFLQVGDRPLLVGWELGKGRVMCWLADQRGQSDGQTTAFFDWKDWPVVMHAALRWLSSDAEKQVTWTPVPEQVSQLVSQLQDAGFEDDLAVMDEEPGVGGLAAPGEVVSTGRDLDEKSLQARVAVIEQALTKPDVALTSALLEQLAAVNNLPLHTRHAIYQFALEQRVKQGKLPDAATVGKRAVASGHPAVRGSGYVLLALADDAEFAHQVRNPQGVMGEGQAEQRERGRDMSLASAVYQGKDLLDEARQRIKQWSQTEQQTRDAFIKFTHPDTQLPDHYVYLDAETLMERTAWLVYLSRHDVSYRPAMLREWLLLAQYEDIGHRMVMSIYASLQDHAISPVLAAAQIKGWENYQARLQCLRALTLPMVQHAMQSPDAAMMEVMQAVKFPPEVAALMNLLGAIPVEQSREVLEKLRGHSVMDLSGFSEQRFKSK